MGVILGWLGVGWRGRLGFLDGLEAVFGPVAGVLAKVEANLWLVGRVLVGALVGVIGVVASVGLRFFQSYTALTRDTGGVQQGETAWWFFAALDGNFNWGLDWLAAGLSWETGVFTREDLARFAWLNAIEKSFQVRATQSFLFQQRFGELVQVVAVLSQNVVGLLVSRVQKEGHLIINLGCHGIRVFRDSAATGISEWVAVFLAILDGAQRWAEAVLRNHGAGNLGCLLNIG